MERYLEISWSTSRGRDTYGYNICKLTDTATRKVYRTLGGGYDMLGTVVGDWMQDAYQDRLRAISDRAGSVYTDGVGGSYKTFTNEYGRTLPDHFYGMTREYTSGNVTLDGACGLRAMEYVAEAIGVDLRAIVNRKGHVTGYLVNDAVKVAA